MHAGKPRLRKKYQVLRGRLAKNAGFTLLEMMVVVTIVGVVVMAAYPQYDKMVNRMTYDAAYSDLRTAVSRCRSEAVSSAYPVTVPTTLTFFANGYSCVAWWDRNKDFSLGSNGTAVVGDLQPNSLNGEVREVFFQKRFNPTLELSNDTGEVFIDLQAPTLATSSKLPTGGSAVSGRSIVIAPGGFLLAPNKTAFLNSTNMYSPAMVSLRKRDTIGGTPSTEYSLMQIYVSGQVK